VGINQLQASSLNLIKNDNDFFSLETTNEDYFRTRTSPFLRLRDSLLTVIQKQMAELKRKSVRHGLPFTTYFLAIDSSLKEYNQKFFKLESLIYTRGFKDYGVEGLMRKYAHLLENKGDQFPLTDVLTLRRNEKDFLLRHDTIYLGQFNRHCARLIYQATLKGADFESLLSLRSYQGYFNQRASLEIRIGLHAKSGLKEELNALTNKISRQFTDLSTASGDLNQSTQKNAQILYLSLIASAVLFSIVSSLWIARRLSEPIARLSSWMALPASQKNTEQLSFTHAADEIHTLAHSFIQLINQTNRQMEEIETQARRLQEQNQELNKLNTELDSFLYSTAHDLRSPLTSLLGIVRLMRLENKQPDLKVYLDMMQVSIKRQEDFISQIVNYTKNKKLEVAAERLDLHTMIHEIFQSHEFLPFASEIQKFVSSQLDAPVYGDRGRIQIIFNNLISNAIRYTDPAKQDKWIQIDIQANKEKVRIVFSDNGLGISEEHLGKIFGMFYRASFSSKGSGLGLFILKEAIDKMRGHVAVTSKEGIGTSFTIDLPNQYDMQKVAESNHLRPSDGSLNGQAQAGNLLHTA